VSSNNEAYAKLTKLGNSTSTLDTKSLAAEYVKGVAQKAKSDYSTANERAVASTLQALKATHSSSAEASAAKQEMARKVRLEARIADLSESVDAAMNEYQNANRTEADLELKVRQATLALTAAKKAEHEHTLARDELAEALASTDSDYMEGSRKLSHSETQIAVDRKKAEQVLAEKTALQADSERTSRLKQEGEQLLQHVQTEEKRVKTIADDASSRLSKNAEEQSVARRVAANSNSGLAVAIRLTAAAKEALTDAIGAEHTRTAEEKDASSESVDASEALQGAQADALRDEKEAAVDAHAWAVAKQGLHQKETLLKEATDHVASIDDHLSSAKRVIAVQTKKKRLAEAQVASRWEAEASSTTALSVEVDKMSAFTDKENEESEDVEELAVTEQDEKGEAEEMKEATNQAGKMKENAANAESAAKSELEGVVKAIAELTDKIAHYQQLITEAKARVVDQIPIDKQASATADRQKTLLTSLEGKTQELETQLAAKTQGQQLLKDMLHQATNTAEMANKINELKVTDAKSKAAAAATVGAAAAQRDDKAKVVLDNAPEPIGSPQEAAASEAETEEQRVTTLQDSALQNEDGIEADVDHATGVHTVAESKFNEASSALQAASTAADKAKETVIVLKERAEASAKNGIDEARRLDQKVADAKISIVASENQEAKARTELEDIKKLVVEVKALEGSVSVASSHLDGEQQLEEEQRSEALTSTNRAGAKLEEATEAAEVARSSAQQAKVSSEETASESAQAGTDLQVALRNSRDARSAAIESNSRMQEAEEHEANTATGLTAAEAELKEEAKQSTDADDAEAAAKSNVADSEQQVEQAQAAIEVGKSGIVSAQKTEQFERETANEKEEEIKTLPQKVGEGKQAFRQLDANVKVAELRLKRFENGQDPGEDLANVNHCVRDDGTMRAIDGC